MFKTNERIEKWVKWFRRLIGYCIPEDSQMITMELYKGTVSLLSVPQQKNIFKTKQYTLLDFFPKVLLRAFMRFSNLFLLGISLIMLIDPTLSPYYRWITIFPLGLGVIFYCFCEAILDHLRGRHDHLINAQTTTRGIYQKGGNVEDVRWDEVQIGDVLYLTKGNIVPADLILLDSGQVRDKEALCMLDTQYYDGKSTLTKKKSSYLTQLIVLRTRQKNQFHEYRKMLTGRLEYEAPNGNTTSFHARLKLKKDPKMEQITIDNFLPKGTKIRQTSWIFGLVVYVGGQTKTNMCQRQSKKKWSVEEVQSNIISMIIGGFCLFTTLISIIVLLARSDDKRFVIQFDDNVNNGMKIFNLLILYSQLIPANFYLIFDLINLINKFRIELEYVNREKYKFMQVNNPCAISDLGHIDYLVMDKTGTLTTSYYKLDTFLFGAQAFHLNHDQLFNTLIHTKTKKLEEEEEPLKFGSLQDNEYLIPLEYEQEKKQSNGTEVFQTLRQNQHKINILKSVKTNQNSNIFNQVTTTLAQQNQTSQQELQQSIKLPDSQYYTLKKSLFSRRKQDTSSQMNNNDEFLQMVWQYKMRSPQKDYLESVNENALLYDSLMKCLMLCHEARPVYYAEDTTYESFSKNEEIALTFARLCGYSLEQFNKFEDPDAYLCKVRGNNVWYKILGLNVFTYSRNLNSIVVQAPQSADIDLPDAGEFAAINQLSGQGSRNQSLLICKGDYDAIKLKLELSHKEREELDHLVNFYKIKGIRIIIYATRVLSEHLTKEYNRKFGILHSSLTNQDKSLEDLSIEYETHLNLLGMVGFKEELKNDAYELVQTAKSSNINTWLLSGDQEAQTISCALALELCDYTNTKFLRVADADKNQIWMQMNAALGQIQAEMQKSKEKEQEEVKKQEDKEKAIAKSNLINSSTTIYDGVQFQKMGKFALLINGHSLAVIEQNTDLMSHFRFLVCVCKSVIGFNMTPEQKELLCLTIKQYFPGHPTILAVGDGYNDALMMQAANVGIEVINCRHRHKDSILHPQVNAGDIVVSNLSDIKEIILGIGKLQSERFSELIIYMHYCAGYLAMTSFFFNWFCYFTATSINDSMTVFLFMFLFVSPSAFALGFWGTPTNTSVNKQFPGLYIDGQLRVRQFLYFYFLEGFLESLLCAALTFYVCAYMVDYATNDKGWNADFQMTSLAIIYSMILVATFKIFIRLVLRGQYIIGLLQLFILGCLTGFVFINYRADFSEWDYEELTYQIFTRFNSIVAIVFSVCFCYFINFVLHHIIRFTFFPTAYEQFAFLNQTGSEWEAFSNREIILNTIDQQVHVSDIISNVFVDCASPSPYIQEMLNPGDTKVTEMKVRPITLEMKELVLEQKFSASKLKPSLLQLKIFMVLLLLYFVGYAFTDFFINDTPVFNGVQYLIIFGIVFILILFVNSSIMEQNYFNYSHFLVFVLFCIKVAIDWLSDSITISLSSALLVLFATFNTMNFKVVPIIIYNIAYLIQLIVRVILVVIHEELDTSNQYSQGRISVYAGSTIIILLISITLRFLFSYYKSLKHRRNDYLARYQIEQDNLAAQDILSILVPKFVQQQIQTGIYSMQEAQDDVSILFCYICDFDSIMKEEGQNVVLMLDQLFRLFDNLCLQHGVQKIETVGYTYMAATGIKACEQGVSSHMLRTEKTMRLVNLAFDMMTQVVDRKYGKGNQIEMKIGIHVGRVIAGVIGYHKPQFSLIGDPVNQTSRVGSTGDVGAITLSEEAYKQAKSGIKWQEKKQKQAKGLGLINTYQVFKERPVNYQININQQRWQKAAKLVLQNDPTIKSKQTNKEGLVQKIKGQMQLQGNVHESASQFVQLSSPRIPALSSSNLNQFQVKQSVAAIPPSQSQLPQQQQQPEITEDSDIHQTENDENYKDKVELIKPNILLSISQDQADTYQSFHNIIQEQNEQESLYGFIFLWVTYFVITLLTIVIRKVFGEDDIDVFVLRALFVIVMFLVFPLMSKAYSNRLINWTYYLIICYGSFTILYQAFVTRNSVVGIVSLLELMYILIVSFQSKLFSFPQILVYNFAVFGVFLGFYISNNIVEHFHIYYLACVIILSLVNYYQGMSEQVQMFNNLQINEEKKVKQIALVSQLLPTHAYLKMKNSSIYSKSDFIDEFEDVTLLFADIKGFTEYSHTQTPEGVVTMLRNLFTEFDKLCQKYNVYKMYTIGDCYVVMGFTNSAKRNPIQEAINTVKMGFQMVDIIMKVRKEINFNLLNMRIGIHTGPVIGGIIGTDIVRYDIYGKDVSIANKMESSGVEGRVQVSETTKMMIDRADKNPFQFKYHQDVDLAKFGMNLKGYLAEWNRDYLEQSGSVRTPPLRTPIR